MAKSALRERIDALSKQSSATAPSLVPKKRESKPKPEPKKGKPEEPYIPAAQALPKGSAGMLAEMAEAYALYAAREKAAKDAKDELSTQIKALCVQHKLSRVQTAGYKLSYFNSPRSTIKADLLLAKGVQPSIIADCTQKTDAWQIRVTALAAAEEE